MSLSQGSSKNSAAAAYVGLIIVFVLWGSLYVVSTIVLRYMPTFAVMFCRFLIAYLALTVIVKVSSRNWKNGVNAQGRKTRIDANGRKYVILLGVCGYAVSVSLQLLGTKYAGSTMASLINSLNPVTISLMAVPILHEKLTGNKIVGILLAVFGVYLIVGTGGQFNVPGILLSLGSVLGWSLVSVLTRQGLEQYEPLVITRSAIGVAAVCEFFFALAEHFVTHVSITINLSVVLGLLFLGIFCTGVAYILWNKALAALPASNCSALYPIQPLTSAALGILLFGESISLSFVMGTVCIIAGVLITLLWKSSKQH